MALPLYLECALCGGKQPYEPFVPAICKGCQSQWLEAKKTYRVFHARDGWEGLTLARQKLPDLIISDLMMPGIDGFGLVEELKLGPRTRTIPVVLVSAKDISPEERKRLNGHIEAVYQKGSLSTRKFVDQVIQVIADKNGE